MPLLCDLYHPVTVVCAPAFSRFWLQQGEKIAEQGKISSDFFLIEEGVCEASISYVDEQTGEQVHKALSTMERGEHFGETALLPGDAKPRTASVTAITEVECLRLDRDSFQRVTMAR